MIEKEERTDMIIDVNKARLEKLNLMPQDILIVKSPNMKDAHMFAQILTKLKMHNLVVHLTQDITLETLPKEKVEAIMKYLQEGYKEYDGKSDSK